MNALEALEELKCVLSTNPGTKRYADIFDNNLISPIEKRLRAFEIIKNKNVNVFMVKETEDYDKYLKSRPPLNVVDYDGVYHRDQVLTKEEFDFIKEELK